MCLAKAYLGTGETTELILEDVALLSIDGNKLNLRTLFGEQKEIEGLVKEVSFQNGQIVIERIA